MEIPRRHGTEVACQELPGDRGRLDGVLGIGQHGQEGYPE